MILHFTLEQIQSNTIGISELSAVVLNLVLAFNHKAGRYTAIS